MTRLLKHLTLRVCVRTTMALALCSSAQASDAIDPRLTECARHDQRALNLIEHRAEIPAIRSVALFESWNLVLDARAACGKGQFEQAYAAYEAVDAKLLGPASIENGEGLTELEAE